MATKMCQHGNCSVWGESSEMICVSGGGFRQHYCSWIHAALGCLHHIWCWDRKTASGEKIVFAETLLDEAHRLRTSEQVTVR